MDLPLYVVTLNWNSSTLLGEMIRTMIKTVDEPISWAIVDNGSHLDDAMRLCAHWFGLYNDVHYHRFETNQGMILAHNLALDVIARLQTVDGVLRPYEVVLIDADVEVYQEGWLPSVREWARGMEETTKHQPIGIVGMEHSKGEVCAPGVFLDKNGNWYIHQTQTKQAKPVPAESVGLGFALLRWPLLEAGLRFDEGFKIYYKQDDDLCFQARALGLGVWAYPVDCWHRGSAVLKAADYYVSEDIPDRNSLEDVKRLNQAYFAKKWEWALDDRRPNYDAERAHLLSMSIQMAQRRKSS